MKNLLLPILQCSLVLLLFSSIYGQTEKFDVMTFNSPKGWSVEKTEDSYRFTKGNKKSGQFCLMVLSKSFESHGSPKTNFEYIWNELFKKHFGAEVPEKLDVDEQGEVTIVQSGATIKYQKIDSIAALISVNSKKHFVSVVAITNNSAYLDEVFNFISTVDFNFPQ